eukprot:scaffold33537_cov21-Tisochrysis_lutea.AAC.4
MRRGEEGARVRRRSHRTKVTPAGQRVCRCMAVGGGRLRGGGQWVAEGLQQPDIRDGGSTAHWGRCGISMSGGSCRAEGRRRGDAGMVVPGRETGEGGGSCAAAARTIVRSTKLRSVSMMGAGRLLHTSTHTGTSSPACTKRAPWEVA